MSTPTVVTDFYNRIWNSGDLAATSDLLIDGFSFRGSLGNEMRGPDAFRDYVRSVRGSLAHYHCEVLDCVTEGNKAFAKMRFAGVHTAPFRGYEPTGKLVHWFGAALFILDGNRVAELWVLGDLVGLDSVLQSNMNAKS